MSHWATDMAALINTESRSAAKGQNSNVLHIAEVISTSPLTISINGQNILKHLYINPAYFLQEAGAFDKKISISNVGSGTINAEWYSFMETFHKAYEIAVGDKVIVMQSRTSFYILQKVVAV